MTLRPTLIVFTILGTLAYLGLAILGLGGFAAFFSHPALIALTVVFFLLSAVAPFSAGNLSSGEREDRGNRWVIAVFGVLGLLLGYVPAYTERIGVWVVDGDAVLGVIVGQELGQFCDEDADIFRSHHPATFVVSTNSAGEEQVSVASDCMQFVEEPGTFSVMIGSSSDDIRLTGEFEAVP